MRGLPVIDYVSQIKALLQGIIIQHAPPTVQKVFDNTATRPYLRSEMVEVRVENSREDRYPFRDRLFGLNSEVIMRMDPRTEPLLKEGSMYAALYTGLRDSGLLEKQVEQAALRRDVSKRLEANLEAATTLKRLREILEPPLHRFIPEEPDAVAKSNLPSVVTPVVDDLKKLGLEVV
jgi:hypothetical protein